MCCARVMGKQANKEYTALYELCEKMQIIPDFTSRYLEWSAYNVRPPHYCFEGAATMAAVLRRDQQKHSVLRTAQGLVPLRLGYGGSDEGSDEEGVT